MSDLSSRTKRADLEVLKRHQERVAKGKYLMYRRPSNGAGTWYCKLLTEEGHYKQDVLGIADDEALKADGVEILDYDQAKKKATGTLQTMLRNAELEAGGEVIPIGPYTVADAWTDYIADAKRRGVVGVKIMQTTYDAHIMPELGPLQVSRLTKAKITKWHQGLAAQGKRKTGRKRDSPEYMEAPTADDAKRKRRDTANRILTNLKACCNFAIAEGKAQEPAPWRQVEPFPNASSNRVRILDQKEQKALIANCDDDLRPLVLAALYTGARYGELCPVHVRDFDAENGSLFIEFGKGRLGTKPRHVLLTKEGAEWFAEHVKGKSSDYLMFLRTDVVRGSRAETLANPNQWASYDQGWAMDQAVARAKISRVTFHELRHTYASEQLNNGVALSYVAEQLGHTDLRMVTKYYGHIVRALMHKAVRKGRGLGLNKIPR